MKDQRLYDVLDAVQQLREELTILVDGDYKFDRIIQGYRHYHNATDKEQALESYLYHGGFEGTPTEDGKVLQTEVRKLYEHIEYTLDEPDKTIVDLSLDEYTGALVVELR